MQLEGDGFGSRVAIELERDVENFEDEGAEREFGANHNRLEPMFAEQDRPFGKIVEISGPTVMSINFPRPTLEGKLIPGPAFPTSKQRKNVLS